MAAATRRSLVYAFRHFSGRVHPSFSHAIVTDDRERSDPPPSPPPLKPSFRSPFKNPNFTFSLPFGLRHYSSSPSTPGAEGSGGSSFINDVAEVLTDPASTAAAAASAVPASFPGEVAAASADSFLPVAALQHLIDAIHTTTGLDWWASIALTTVFIRVATIPLVVNQMKTTSKLNEMRPELEALKEKMGNTMDPVTMTENQKKMKELFNKHGVTPFSPLKGLFIQGPMFICFFYAIQNMVAKVPSFKSGGALWFTDLTIPDPYYAFPVLTAATFLATVELNMQDGMEGNPMADTMKKFSRVLGLLTVPFTASFPQGVFCYWITSNFMSLVYGYVFRQPPVRKFLKLPNIPPPDSAPKPKPKPDFSSLFSKMVVPSSLSSSPSSSTSLPADQSEPVKSSTERNPVSSAAVISQRIRNLEKTVKGRNKPKKKKR